MTGETERLARIEAQIGILLRRDEAADKHREEVAGRLAAIERDVHHMQDKMPVVDINTARNQYSKGYNDAMVADHKDDRARAAMWTSVLAVLVSIFVAVRSTFWGG